MIKVGITKAHCNQCGHDWKPRGETVTQCPDCRSVKFDQPGPEGPTIHRTEADLTEREAARVDRGEK